MERIRHYAICEACGELVCRIPGWHHGDGQIDTDENPVWLLGDARDYGNTEELPRVNCGCTD